MKQILIVITATLLFTLTVNGQDLFFIGENSYSCAETMTLKSNSDDDNDLNIFLAKDGNTGLFAVVVESYFGATFSKEIIIYLQDGTVIKCNNKVTYDYVDRKAKAVYSLKEDQLNSIRNSNIHTVRYTLELTAVDDNVLNKEWNRSASNKGIPTKTIVSNFLDGKIKDIVEFGDFTDGEDEGTKGVGTGTTNSYVHEEGSGAGDGSISFSLGGRTSKMLPRSNDTGQKEGIIVVEIRVNSNGDVISANPGVKGSTTLDEYLCDVAKQAALKAKFSAKPDAPDQIGTITYHFELR